MRFHETILEIRPCLFGRTLRTNPASAVEGGRLAPEPTLVQPQVQPVRQNTVDYGPGLWRPLVKLAREIAQTVLLRTRPAPKRW